MHTDANTNSLRFLGITYAVRREKQVKIVEQYAEDYEKGINKIIRPQKDITKCFKFEWDLNDKIFNPEIERPECLSLRKKVRVLR